VTVCCNFVQHFPDHEREEKQKILQKKQRLMYVGNKMCKFASISIWIEKISCDFIIIIIIILNLVAWFLLRKLEVRFASTPLHKKEHFTFLKIRKPMELMMQEIRRNGILSSEWIEKHFPCLLAKLEDWERRVWYNATSQS
jgi:hypothetical protein